ncbi:hypothetical protein LI99_05790 [Mycolicibacterium smegmatis]|uniref:Uncharacterized protein n=2 Tax=Mycolicibacterium smegmatis (strain ATCC 700084 / mc(2)155) TaxID=246196 RepID=I7G4X7_MYCS2|nr:hypothetical protein MSMEG_1163 [Mycolicibacterium smegmatis MC2 155]AFP37609.1 hypothetical protein MSMEI_1131 [Mycolicibacterium smegmatis MC2 155]AIU06411.1 hypothetical protein LJ00_05790 [Mycolicibacterium smegmatis MC2 155]AIU13036.1 hypothetical protein LI99_05790 [Mycolicibacterium smegmatis]AIU19660.1 hypothetical protein LI98_05790 [Mycolicibacterium smegmatis]
MSGPVTAGILRSLAATVYIPSAVFGIGQGAGAIRRRAHRA